MTAIVEYPMPRIPSNLAATKAMPGSLTASAKVCPSMVSPRKIERQLITRHLLIID